MMEEKVLMEGLCNRIKGAYVENGHALLTNKRFIYAKHGLAKIAVIGLLVNLTQGEYEFDVPVENIKEYSIEKRLLSKILVIKTKKGEEYKFGVTKIMKWDICLNNILNESIGVEKESTHRTVNSEADEIVKYKQLLDDGIITQEEFAAKKKQLLGL